MIISDNTDVQIFLGGAVTFALVGTYCIYKIGGIEIDDDTKLKSLIQKRSGIKQDLLNKEGEYTNRIRKKREERVDKSFARRNESGQQAGALSSSSTRVPEPSSSISSSSISSPFLRFKKSKRPTISLVKNLYKT